MKKFNYFNWGEEDILFFMTIFQMFWNFFALSVDRKKNLLTILCNLSFTQTYLSFRSCV